MFLKFLASLRQGLSLAWNLPSRLGWLASFLYLSRAETTFGFLCGFWNQTSILMLVIQAALDQQNYSPAQVLFFFKFFTMWGLND